MDPVWQIRMLGRFEVVSAEAPKAAFRSRKVASLLALLAIHKGRPVANATLQELLWPDSDGDRQAQSLRRAVADLRDALEAESTRGALVRTDQGTTSLDPEEFETDVERFESLLSDGPEAEGFELKAAEAVALYGGPLLATLDDDWVHAYRRQHEETFCRAVTDLCEALIRQGHAREAVRIASSAIPLAPYREEPYTASILAYASADNRSMAIRQFEALETMLDDTFGQTPSEVSLSALDAPPSVPHPITDRPEPARAAPREVSGGALPTEDRYYIEREADATVRTALDDGEAVVLVFGPRQVGKTSLLARKASALRRGGIETAATDFQALSKSEIERPATLYRALIHSLASQLGLTYEPSWNEWIGPNSNLDAQVGALLKQTKSRVCWLLDEVDRLFGLDFADDFFGLVRSWHNRRALDPEGPWSRLSLLISYATEAHLFITDLNQSPFNVGVRVNLRDFSEAEVAELGSRYPEFVGRWSKEVYEITRGHPFLTRRAFGFLESKRSIEELEELAAKEEGPFGDHLRRLWDVIHREAALVEVLRRVLSDEQISNNDVCSRLISAGVFAPGSFSNPVFRVPVYGSYLKAALSPGHSMGDC